MPKLARLDVPLFAEPLAREACIDAAWVSGQFRKSDDVHAETAARLEHQRASSMKNSRRVLLRTAVSLILFSVVAALLLYYRSVGNVLAGLHRLSPFTICVIFAALMANALAAALRFQLISAFTGHAIGFRRAMAAVGAGTLAGAAFFQIAGQLMARGFIARQNGMPFAAVVVVTGYERIVAAIMSGLLAIAGAWFIFGKVYLDQSAGAADLIKVACGLVLAVTGGALAGYGRTAARAIAPLMTRNFAWRCLGAIGLTLLVQLPMMAAYVVAAHALSPHTPVAGLIAASAIVMFAASVPISLAGWGVREMSAIIALGAIGVAASDALTAAVVIGAGSMLAMAIIAVISMPGSEAAKANGERPIAVSIDYSRALALTLPVAAAIFVLFQIYVPVGAGLLNVNLADPIAILGGALFVIGMIRHRQLPRWRVDNLNTALAATTLALTAALMIGASRFGWLDWAVVNRFLGWFVLLAFGATGALAIGAGGEKAFGIVLRTYIGAVSAVSLLETGLVLLTIFGIASPAWGILPFESDAFAQNHNAFAFQLLMALAATLVALRERRTQSFFLTVLLVGLWFSGSRSGWIAMAVVLLTSVYLGTTATSQVLRALTWAAIVAAVTAIVPLLLHHVPLLLYNNFRPDFFPSESSTAERMTSIIGGLKLFVANPLFGAGLGAFQTEKIMSNGVPLVIHSTAVWLLAELGIVGFVVFVGPALYVFAVEWRRSRKDQVAAFVVFGFIVMSVMSGPADMLYQRTFWLLIGAALAV